MIEAGQLDRRRASARTSCRRNADLSLVKQRLRDLRPGEHGRPRARCSRKEGILAGSSSGTLLAAALRYCREQTTPKRVVTFVCDSGNKYLSKVFNDYWLIEQGLAERSAHGDLRDLDRAHAIDEGGTVTVGARRHAAHRLQPHARAPTSRSCRCSKDGRLVGILDESDILAAVEGSDDDRAARFKAPVSSAMTSALNTVQADAAARRAAADLRAQRGGDRARRRGSSSA